MRKPFEFCLFVIAIGLAVLAVTGTANATTYSGVAFCNEAAVSSNTRQRFTRKRLEQIRQLVRKRHG